MGNVPKDGWDKLSAVTPLITGGVIVVLLFFIKGSVDQALKEREFELTSVREMRDILVELRTGQLTQPKAEANATALAAFGRYAVVPLISILQTGGDASVVAARKALQLLTLTRHRPHACEALGNVIGNRTQLFTWQVHREAIRLLGSMNCGHEGERQLRRYQAELSSGKLGGWAATVSTDPKPTEGDLELVREDLELAITLTTR